MSVREYEAKFNDLSRFSPSLEEFEHMKCLKFEKGLRSTIQRSLLALRLRVYRDLVATVISVEQDNLEYYQSKETTNRALGEPQQKNRKNRDQKQTSEDPSSGSSSSLGSDRSGPYRFRCHHCGQLVHIKRNCPNRNQQLS